MGLYDFLLQAPAGFSAINSTDSTMTTASDGAGYDFARRACSSKRRRPRDHFLESEAISAEGKIKRKLSTFDFKAFLARSTSSRNDT